MAGHVDYFIQDIPAHFELGVLNQGEGLILSAQSEFASYLEEITANTDRPLFTKFDPKLRLSEFKGFTGNSAAWGFGEILHTTSEKKPGWISWECPFPRGSFISTEEEWAARASVSATLKVFSTLTRTFEGTSSSVDPQLFFMNLGTGVGFGDNFLAVELTKAFVEWVATQDETIKHPRIAPIMRAVYDRLRGLPSDEFERVGAWIKKPFWVNLVVPGSACGLDPGDYYFQTGTDGKPIIKGYELHPHNVDSITQQLTLLSGIAAMHDEARKL